MGMVTALNYRTHPSRYSINLTKKRGIHVLPDQERLWPSHNGCGMLRLLLSVESMSLGSRPVSFPYATIGGPFFVEARKYSKSWSEGIGFGV